MIADSWVADSGGCDWKKGWRVVGDWSKGRPWVCSVQALLKQETDPRGRRAHFRQYFEFSTKSICQFYVLEYSTFLYKNTFYNSHFIACLLKRRNPTSREWGLCRRRRVKRRYPSSKVRETSSNNTREDSTHGHHQMVNTEIRWLYSL